MIHRRKHLVGDMKKKIWIPQTISMQIVHIRKTYRTYTYRYILQAVTQLRHSATCIIHPIASPCSMLLRWFQAI